MQTEPIRITPGVRQKFIVAHMSRGGSEEFALWGNPNITWHKDIADELIAAGYEVNEVLGGGWLLLDPGSNTLHIWGKSDRYGAAPMNLIRTVIDDSFSIVEHEPSER